MDEIIRRKEDDIVRKPYKEVVELLDEQPFTELLKDDRGGEYQLEIQLTWDDKSKGVIRVAAFLSGGSGKKWWDSLFSRSQYERFITPKDN